jgi:hypothetical protein
VLYFAPNPALQWTVPGAIRGVKFGALSSIFIASDRRQRFSGPATELGSLGMKGAFTMKTVGYFFIGCILSGCASALLPVAYNQSVLVTSQKVARIELVSGEVSGNLQANVGIIAGNPGQTTYSAMQPTLVALADASHFCIADQQMFIRSLSDELVRRNVLSLVLESSSTAKEDLFIKVTFVKTFHETNFHNFILDVNIEISGTGQHVEKSYTINTKEKSTTWKRIAGYNAQEGKMFAASLLMQKIFPDIEQFLQKQRI